MTGQEILQTIINHVDILILILLSLGVSKFFGYRKKKLSSSFIKKVYDDNKENNEEYISYYAKKQKIQGYQVIIRTLVVVYATLQVSPNILSGLVIALGALVISFQTFLVAWMMYFQISAAFTTGEGISVGGYQGELISIRPLHIDVLGKNSHGEHTGELYRIPNNFVRLNPITRIDLSAFACKKFEIKIPFQQKQFSLGLQGLISLLDQHIEERPQASPEKVKHYKSFIGKRHKIAVSYKDHETIEILAIVIVPIKDFQQLNEGLITYIESLKRTDRENDTEKKTQ